MSTNRIKTEEKIQTALSEIMDILNANSCSAGGGAVYDGCPEKEIPLILQELCDSNDDKVKEAATEIMEIVNSDAQASGMGGIYEGYPEKEILLILQDLVK